MGLQANLQDPALLAFAASLDLEVNDLERFFYILSAEGKRRVDLEAFVVGCIKMRGTARSMDLFDLQMTQREEVEHIRTLERYCKRQFERLYDLLSANKIM